MMSSGKLKKNVSEIDSILMPSTLMDNGLARFKGKTYRNIYKLDYIQFVLLSYCIFAEWD